jgi:hypothetical protein
MGRLKRGKGAVAGVAALVLVSACGGSSGNQSASFKSGYNAAANQLKQVSHDIGMEIQQASKQTDAQVVAAFRRLASRWQTHLSQLQTLKPPSNLAAEFNTVSGAAGRVETDLNNIVAAGRTHSGAAARQAAASLVNDVLTAKAASIKITNKLGNG